MDNLTKEQRRKNMQNIKSTGTIPERMLARALRLHNVYFSKNVTSLPGKPDIVFRKTKVAVFVDSDFWHGHPKRFIMPKSSLDYWKNKIQSNIQRDKKVNRILKSEGWKVVRLWEHDVRNNINNCMLKIIQGLDGQCQLQ